MFSTLQEERLSLMLGDIREELLDRLDGLQLRLQVSPIQPSTQPAAQLLSDLYGSLQWPIRRTEPTLHA